MLNQFGMWLINKLWESKAVSKKFFWFRFWEKKSLFIKHCPLNDWQLLKLYRKLREFSSSHKQGIKNLLFPLRPISNWTDVVLAFSSDKFTADDFSTYLWGSRICSRLWDGRPRRRMQMDETRCEQERLLQFEQYRGRETRDYRSSRRDHREKEKRRGEER